MKKELKFFTVISAFLIMFGADITRAHSIALKNEHTQPQKSPAGPLLAGTYLVLNESNQIARSNDDSFDSNYRKNYAFNKKTILTAGTTVRYTGQSVKKNTGWGIEVDIVNGHLKGEKSWIWYSAKDKSIATLPSNFEPDDDPTKEATGDDEVEGQFVNSKDDNCETCKKGEHNQFGEIVKSLNGASSFLSELSAAAKGARKVLATMFQTCSVLDMLMPSRRGRNPFDFVKYDHRPVCRDVGNPRYSWGSKPSITRNTINVTQRRNAGIDCSGFITAAWAVAGLRIHANNDSPATYGMNTQEILNQANRKGSCLNSVKLEDQDFIKSGDIIVQTRGNSKSRHVVMIESTGKDPFGLDQINRIEQCSGSRLDTDNFNFTIIQSSGGVGPARWKAKDYLAHSGSSFTSAVMSIARKACRAKFSRQTIYADGKNGPLHYALIRHNNTPACINPNPPDLKQEQCIEGCPRLSATN